MSDACYPYRRLARNNRLANMRLLTACGALAPGEFAAKRTSFFPSIKATLNHILTIDWFYVDALEGGSLGRRAWDPEVPFASVAELAPAQAAVDARLLALCDALTPGRLPQPVQIHRSGRIQVETVADTLLHLFHHQAHHRGQVHAMLAGTSVPPPQLDEFLMQDDAALRGRELAAVGWSEADLAR